MRLAWFIVLFFCLGPFMPAPVSARVDEGALVKRVRAAQGRVDTAERELRQTQAKYQPVIASYQAAEAEVARLAAAWQAARETLWDDANKEKELPKSLEARKEALLEHYSRMQLLHLKDKSSANKTKLLLSKRKYEEVQRQIRDFNAGNAQAKRRFAAAEARYDRLWDQYVKARDRLPRLRLDVESGEDQIARDRDYLSTARDELQKAKSEARWRLNENAPPYLEKVVVKRGGETFYEAEWGASEEQEEAEELLRLAQYLHEDLGRTIPKRTASRKDWWNQALAHRRKATEVLEVYTDMMGGSYSGGFMGAVEGALDYTLGLGALVTFGSHPWKKSFVESVDAALTIFRDIGSGVPPHIAIATEAAFQVGDVLIRAAQGTSKNPSWDITSMPHARLVNVNEHVTWKNMNATIDGLKKGRIRSSLELMRNQVKAGLKGEDFRQQLVRRYQGETLAIALSQTVVTLNMPRLEGLKEWNPGGSILDATFNFFTQPTGATKTSLKTAFYARFYPGKDAPISAIDLKKRGKWQAEKDLKRFEDAKDFARTLGKDIFLDAVQAAARDGIIEQLERQRLEAWYDWVAADANALTTLAILQNEGRLYRLDKHIQKILAEQLIPELTAEVERLRAFRELDIVRDATVEDERATLVLTFSSEVDIERVTLGDVALAPRQKRDNKWEAGVDPEQFEDADGAPLQLTVQARPLAFEDRQLDDPKTVASWSTQTSSFNAYEQKPDIYHRIQLKPEEEEIAGEIAYRPMCVQVDRPDDLTKDRMRAARRAAAAAGLNLGDDAETDKMLDEWREILNSETEELIYGIQDMNQQMEILPGFREHDIRFFPVRCTMDARLFCIPGQPCYLAKDGQTWDAVSESVGESIGKGSDAFEKFMREALIRGASGQ